MSAPIATYRAELRAIDLGDGRHLILGEPPEYCESVLFRRFFAVAEQASPPPSVGGRKVVHPVKPSRQLREWRAGPRRAIALDRPAKRTHPKRAKAEQLLGKGKTPKQVSVTLGLPYATVYGWSRKLPPPAPPAPAGPSAEGAPRAPRTTEQIREDRRQRDDQAIGTVREQIAAQDRQRAAAEDGGGTPDRPRLQPGEKPGTGRKVCKKCHIVNTSRAKECDSCGAKFESAAAR